MYIVDYVYTYMYMYMYIVHELLQLAAKVSALQQQIVETERQKQMVHEYLFSNNEAISRVQREIKTTTASMCACLIRVDVYTQEVHLYTQCILLYCIFMLTPTYR